MTDIFIPENPPLMSSEDGRIMGEYLNRQFLAISTFLQSTKAGHAGIYLSAATDIVDQTITDTPTKLVGFDTKLNDETGAIGIIGNNSISFREAGLWDVKINLVFGVDQNSSNITRDVIAYFHNDTQGVLFEPIAQAAIPRYGEALSISGSVPAEAKENWIDEEFSIYLSTITATPVILETATSMEFYALRASNYTYTGV